MKNSADLDYISIQTDSTILDAIKKMDQAKRKLLIVMDNDQFYGLISIGDIQRAILKNIALGTPISGILRKDIKVAHINDSFEKKRSLMLKFRMEMLPVLGDENEIVEIHLWNDVFSEAYKSHLGSLNVPVVIMAGGQGDTS